MELAVSTRYTAADLRRAVSPTHLLGADGLTAAVTAAGTGVVTFEGADLTRWRGDAVEDADGLLVFLRDLDTGRVWTAGWRPDQDPDAYEARFGPGTVEIAREDDGLETGLCLAVAGGAFVGRLRLTARDGRARRVEVTTFAEVVLHDRAADAAHPAFSKLFVQTEALLDHPALVARRRPRSPEDAPVWLAHWLDGAAEAVSWETDRRAFVGRGRHRTAPAALDAPGALGGTVGPVLDPAVALRTVVAVPAGGVAERAFGLAGGRSREAVVDAADALGSTAAIDAAISGAAEAEHARRRRLGLPDDDAEAAGALVGPLLFGAGLRAPAEDRAALHPAHADRSTLELDGAGRLVVLRVRERSGVDAARRLDRFRAYWADLGLAVRLVVIADAAFVGAVGGAVADGTRVVRAPAWTADDLALAASLAHVWAEDAVPAPPTEPVPTAPPGRTAPPAGDGLSLADDVLREFNGLGGFSADGTEYVLHLRPGDDGRPALPPLPWTNVIASERGGFVVSERGAASSWSANSRENRITPWSNDPVEDGGEALTLQDLDSGALWSPTPGPAPAAVPYEVRHGFGVSSWRARAGGVESDVLQSVDLDSGARLVVVRLTNTGGAGRRLAVTASARLALGSLAAESDRLVVTERAGDAVLARNAARGEFSERVAVVMVAAPPDADVSLTTDRAAFLGRFGTDAAPLALVAGGPLDGAVGTGRGGVAHRLALDLEPGETGSVAFVLGEGDDRAAAEALVERLGTVEAIEASIAETRAFWREATTALQVETPEPALDLMVNGWLVYQNLSCRLWGRTAFYQSGGAYGFRDQLQDASAFAMTRPDLTRAQVVRNAAHQFVEGDVLHWWHPPLGKGIRTRFADDLVWLPLLAAHYVRTTGDAGVLDERVRFLTAPPLVDGQDEAFIRPDDAGTSASVYEHAARALDRSLAVGAHGLPLIGTGDWNDGMNRVGRGGRGESVWMAFFLYQTLGDVLPHVEARGDAERADRYRAHRERLRRAVNGAGWDGDWYRRATYDSGAWIGSAASDEAQIDALAQAWAVLSGAAPPERAAQALDALDDRLIDDEAGIIRLLDPPFDRTPHDPGYIKGYLPGVRENGGQYTHAALWAVRAFAEAGRCDRAAALLAMLSPVRHTASPEAVAVYQTEPYVVAADVYGVAPHVGRGGWTWYTGSAGWMWRVAVESVLGLTVEGGAALVLAPCVPSSWPGFSVRYRLPDSSGTVYHVRAERGGAAGLTVDGAPLEPTDGRWRVPLVRDGAEHAVRLGL